MFLMHFVAIGKIIVRNGLLPSVAYACGNPSEDTSRARYKFRIEIAVKFPILSLRNSEKFPILRIENT